MKKLLIISIILFPFQYLAIPLAQSRYDLTCFLLLLITIYYSVTAWRVKLRSFLVLLIFVIIQIFVFVFFSITPLPRFISAMVWLGGLLSIILTSSKITFDFLLFSKIILSLCILSSIIIFIQFFWFHINRPPAFFDEPSSAGLVLFSASAAIISVLTFIQTSLKFKRNALIILLFLLIAGVFSKSMHIITLLIVLSLIVYIKLTTVNKHSFFKTFFSMSILTLMLTFFVMSVFQDSHYLSRIDVSNAKSNLSLLSWLRGYEQMIASTVNSPIFGHGIGSTGYFKFSSVYSDELMRSGIDDLNLKDGFSLAFRLIIEIGPLLFLFFIIYMIKKISLLKNVLNNINTLPNEESIPSIFLFVFSLSLIIGSLLKEPTYARSPLYIGIFLFSSPILENVLQKMQSKLS